MPGSVSAGRHEHKRVPDSYPEMLFLQPLFLGYSEASALRVQHRKSLSSAMWGQLHVSCTVMTSSSSHPLSQPGGWRSERSAFAHRDRKTRAHVDGVLETGGLCSDAATIFVVDERTHRLQRIVETIGVAASRKRRYSFSLVLQGVHSGRSSQSLKPLTAQAHDRSRSCRPTCPLGVGGCLSAGPSRM